eukprot:Gb_29543 [translate_table: standard]
MAFYRYTYYKFEKHKHLYVRFFVGGNPVWKSQANAVCEDVLLEEASPVDSYAYASRLHACSNIRDLMRVHASIFKAGLDGNIFLGTKIAKLYAIWASMENARLVFDKIQEPDGFLWNVMIRGYAINGPFEETMVLYHKMRWAGVQPDNFTFPFVLKACAILSAFQEGKEIHDHILRSGFESDMFVETALVNMYSKCGILEIAHQLFDKMSKRNVVSWNAMIAGYAQNGHANEALTLFTQMQLADMKPDLATILSVVHACAHLAALRQGKWIHGYIIASGFESDVSVGNSLIAMYAKCGSVNVACRIFNEMHRRDVVSWNAMIVGYIQNGHATEALRLFREMQLADVTADSVSMLGVLQAYSQLGALQQGKVTHGYVIRRSFELDVVVGTTLIDMYAKCGSIDFARQLFEKMSKRNVVSWSAMIAGYAQNRHANEALALFNQMLQANLKFDSIAIASVLYACAHLAALHQGKWVHGFLVRRGFEMDVSVENSLVAMYAKCGCVEVARQLFDKVSLKSVVTWSAMIAGYAQSGHAKEALTLFHQMQVAGVEPNSITMVSLLPALAYLAALQQGKWIHGYIIRSGFESDVIIGTALIDMYAKCGSIKIARGVFDKMPERDVVSWSAMIAGYGMHGLGEDALVLFSQMQKTGIKPNHVTFISVLSACTHAGLVNEGCQYFHCMVRDYSITPRMEHYVCMVDLLGRSGRLYEALDFINKMPLEPCATVWGALLGACRIHCNIDLGERVAEHIFYLEPENAGCYVLLSNIYAAAGRWNDVAKVRTLMKDKRVKKIPGCSSIEVNSKVHTFLVGDRSHPQSEKIYAALETLYRQMKEAGYVPDTSFVLQDVEEEVKEHLLLSHSEKLAITFGLINTSPGTPIQITKNLRVCGDCHSATKFISKIIRRDIIVRDANRFHHFKDGLCSCGNYW